MCCMLSSSWLNNPFSKKISFQKYDCVCGDYDFTQWYRPADLLFSVALIIINYANDTNLPTYQLRLRLLTVSILSKKQRLQQLKFRGMNMIKIFSLIFSKIVVATKLKLDQTCHCNRTCDLIFTSFSTIIGGKIIVLVYWSM